MGCVNYLSPLRHFPMPSEIQRGKVSGLGPFRAGFSKAGPLVLGTSGLDLHHCFTTP
jgi:hypothetical protein